MALRPVKWETNRFNRRKLRGRRGLQMKVFFNRYFGLFCLWFIFRVVVGLILARGSIMVG